MTDPAVLATKPDETVEALDRSSDVPAGAADSLLLDDELLVEDVSIDGMCGVY